MKGSSGSDLLIEVTC